MRHVKREGEVNVKLLQGVHTAVLQRTGQGCLSLEGRLRLIWALQASLEGKVGSRSAAAAGAGAVKLEVPV
ncbi:hypothetical protein PtA15_4A590 [Puccinia triticina]|uniref:Uncharacterized protein n=1 Tax=Puccinia triticina TaxID=208348 RepID=A0ABY7CGA9_9BASI|nr:uncharacterized protein PtA15_4A590 [Puccinia triticina]WAQ84139.1 hypothetical protein PtA15_4A590 [Puccinia triticina]